MLGSGGASAPLPLRPASRQPATEPTAALLLQVAEEALRQKLPLKMSLIFANVSESDIIAKDRLDALAKAFPKNFSV